MVAFVTATSSAVVLRPCCVAIHSYPSACRGMISLLKHEPSAQSPWQNTILFFVFGIFVSFDFDSVYLATFKAIHPRQSCLTRIRRQFVVYFCLHRGKFAGKRCKLASFSSEQKPRPNCEWGILDWLYFDLRIGSAAISLRDSFALDSRQPT